MTVRTKVAKYGVQTNIAPAFESIDLETDSGGDFSLLRYVGNRFKSGTMNIVHQGEGGHSGFTETLR